MILDYYYFQYKQNMKSANQIAQTFSELFKQKSLQFHRVQPLLKAFYQLKDKGSLPQRISIINTITTFFLSAVRNELSAIEKLKHDVYYGFLQNSSKKQRREPIKTRRSHHRQVRRGGPEMTLNQILEQAVAEGLNQINNSSMVPPSRQDPAQNLSKISVTLPPFQPEIIAQLSQQVSIHSKTAEKQLEGVDWEPNKLENYQKWLALTQNGINLVKIQRLVRTKKRNPPKKQFIKDEKIDISQEADQLALMQKLQTKLKLSRQPIQRHQRSFKNFVDEINPTLVNFEYLRQQISIKVCPKRIKNVKYYERNSNGEHFLNSVDRSHFHSISASKEKYSNIEKAKTDDLGQKLHFLLNQELLRKQKISFSDICGSKGMIGESKGEIFHRLLHLNYVLEQKEVAQFGQIHISGKVWRF